MRPCLQALTLSMQACLSAQCVLVESVACVDEHHGSWHPGEQQQKLCSSKPRKTICLLVTEHKEEKQGRAEEARRESEIAMGPVCCVLRTMSGNDGRPCGKGGVWEVV